MHSTLLSSDFHLLLYVQQMRQCFTSDHIENFFADVKSVDDLFMSLADVKDISLSGTFCILFREA